MVESLVVISIMVLFFMGMVFFHSLYGQKLRALTLARSAAVAHAMNACADEPTSYIQGQLGGAASTSVPLPGASFDPKAVSAPDVGLSHNSPVANWLATLNFTTEVTTEVDVTTHAGAQAQENMKVFGFQASPSTASFALCGDRESQGNYENVVKSISIHDAFPF
jgi:hypothetical protein